MANARFAVHNIGGDTHPFRSGSGLRNVARGKRLLDRRQSCRPLQTSGLRIFEPFPKSETRRVSPLSSAGALYKTGCQGVNGGVVKRTSAEDSAFCDGWVGNSERRADGGRGAAGVPEGAARSAEPAAPRPPSETSAPRPDHSALLPHPSRDRTMSITCGDLSRNASLNRMGDR